MRHTTRGHRYLLFSSAMMVASKTMAAAMWDGFKVRKCRWRRANSERYSAKLQVSMGT